MQKVVFFIVFLFVFVTSAYAQSHWQSQDESIPKNIPEYLLVIRYWGTVWTQKGDVMTTGRGWVYLYEPYDSINYVVQRLQTYTGPGMSAQQRQVGLIGLWRLGEKRNISDVLKLDETKHEKEVKVEKEEWIERKWSVKPQTTIYFSGDNLKLYEEELK